MTLATGTVLAGRYEITSPIATGGMGEVWRARDRVLERVVAAKVLRSEYTGDPNFLARFRNEGRHTAALSHPNIASVYDYGETDDEQRPGQRLAFLLMELVEGEPLVTILYDEGRLSVQRTLDVLAQAADGLSAAHAAGVVHRDIKPGNLIVRPDGVVKLTDFGIARARDAIPLTRTGMVVGTAQYLSPEQAQGFEVAASSDVYSLGVVGYECLTGVRPFDGTSQVAIALAHINKLPPPLPDAVPRAVRQLLERAMAKHPEERFDDGAAFAAAIRAVAAAIGSSPIVLPAPANADTQATRVVDMPAHEPVTTVLGAAARTGAGAAQEPRTMPPLQRLPNDDDGWDDDSRDDDGQGGKSGTPGRRRWLWAAGALVILAVLVAGYLVLTSGNKGGGSADPTTSSAPASTTGPGVTAEGVVAFAAADVLGRDVDDAAELLAGRGFIDVVSEPASAEQLDGYGVALAARGVAAVDPDPGEFPAETTITLYYAARAYAPDDGSGSDPTGSTGGGQPTSAAPTGDGAPATPTTTPTSTAVVPPEGSATETTTTSNAPGTTLPPPPPASTTAPSTTAEVPAPTGAEGALG